MSPQAILTPSFQIHRVSESHLPVLCRLVNEESKRSAATVAHQDERVDVWIDHWKTTQSRYPWLVVLDPQKKDPHSSVLGYAKASSYNQREGFQWTVVLSIYLDPICQGKRVGSLLYQKLIEILKHQGYCVAYARITLPNPASIALHERFGFKQIGILPHFAWKFNRWHNQALLVSSFHTSLPHSPPVLRSVDEVLKENPTLL